MSWLRWEPGRQGGGYDKLMLVQSKRLKFDLFLLRLPKTSMVRHHTDPVAKGFEHHRVNITIRRARVGGRTYIERGPNSFLPEDRRAYRFRPDACRHYVTPVMKGSVWLLSFGWLRKSNG